MKYILILAVLFSNLSFGQAIFYNEGKKHIAKHMECSYDVLYRYYGNKKEDLTYFIKELDTFYYSEDKNVRFFTIRIMSLITGDVEDTHSGINIFDPKTRTKYCKFYNNTGLYAVRKFTTDIHGDIIYEFYQNYQANVLEETFTQYDNKRNDTLSIWKHSGGVTKFRSVYFDTGEYASKTYRIKNDIVLDSSYLVRSPERCKDTIIINHSFAYHNLNDAIKQLIKEYEEKRPAVPKCFGQYTYLIYPNNITAKFSRSDRYSAVETSMYELEITYTEDIKD